MQWHVNGVHMRSWPRRRGRDLASRASGGAYSAVCSSSEGPSLPYSCSMECLSTAEPKSISRTCKSPTDRGVLGLAPMSWLRPDAASSSSSPCPFMRKSRFSGFTSLQASKVLVWSATGAKAENQDPADTAREAAVHVLSHGACSGQEEGARASSGQEEGARASSWQEEGARASSGQKEGTQASSCQ